MLVAGHLPQRNSPPMRRKAKLTKREIVLGIAIGVLGATAATGIVSDGFGGPGS